jgi:hypothetical protein
MINSKWLDKDRPGAHSIGIRPHPHNRAIARSLLDTANIKPAPTKYTDERPLIDLLQEATFHDSTSMQFVSDKYALRMLLRKAHCFTLDRDTSRLVSDFSLAIANDLEAARTLAIPPYPVTWFDLDNIARLDRLKEHGVPLTVTASRADVCPRVGWLIHPASDMTQHSYYLTYAAQLEQGMFVAPLSFCWHIARQIKGDVEDEVDKEMRAITFGVADANVSTVDAFPSANPFHYYYRKEKVNREVVGMMREISGELRHVWGLLLALGAGKLGAETSITPREKPNGDPPIIKGKPLLPLEHKTLTIKLGRRKSVERIAAKALTGSRKRWHEVRAHIRILHNADGTPKYVKVSEHHRGDERIGKITKNYRVEK